MKRTDFVRKLRAAGWAVVRQGKHEIWGKGTYTFAVPRHNEISDGTARGWEKLNETASKDAEDEEDEKK